MTEKYCNKCDKTKDKALFYKNKNNKDGLQSNCKECNKAAVANYQKANTAKVKAAVAKYQKSDKFKAAVAKYQKSNPAKCNAIKAKRRAIKLHQTPSWYESEKEAIAQLYTDAQLLSEMTKVPHHVDHVVPLNSKLVSGFHCLANLRILPAKENISKGNRTWPDQWA
jgi:hypothetical protein